jgi:hypothetical protein
VGINTNPADHGAAVPTIIIPTVGGVSLEEVFSILGTGTEEDREKNMCGYRGFICGTNPSIPSLFYEKCITPPAVEGMRFVSSINCFPDGPHFYAAMLRRKCDDTFCDDDEFWGLAEVMEAPNAVPGADPDYDMFRSERAQAFRNAGPDEDGKGRYVNTSGASIRFVINDDGSELTSINGDAISRARDGDILRVDWDQGEIATYLKSPVHDDRKAIVIRFNSWDNPVREER